MNPVRPRALLHRGVIDAAGFLFDPGLIPAAEARRRILSLLTPDARVYRLNDRLLLRLPRSRRVSSDRAPGLPLTLAGDLLTSVPLSAAEADALSPSSDAVVLMRGGIAVAQPLRDKMLESPASWIDTGSLAPVEMISLGAPPGPPVVIVDETPFDPRKRLERIPDQSSELRGLLQSIREGPGGGSLGAGVGAVGGVIAGFLSALFGSFAGGSAGNGGGGNGSGGVGNPSDRGMGGWREKFISALLGLPLLGRFNIGRQARFIAEMLEMFRRGEFDEALRHALPLNNPQGGAALNSFFTQVVRRKSLALNMTGGRSSGSFGLPGELMAHIESVYRNAVNTLESRGEIDEAAFILLELLNKPLEAMEFLERHGRFRLAAELAEGRKMEGSIVVRAWFLAGDVDRAIRIARRTGAFADAIAQLQGNRPDDARRLRLLWGEMLARAGDYPAVIEVLWGDDALHPVAAQWVDLVIEGGGIPAARMLGRLLRQDRDGVARGLDRALALLEADDREGAGARLVLAETIVKGVSAPLARGVARAAVRALLRDAAAGESFPAKKDFKRLVEIAGDGALKSDLPSFEVADAGGLLNRAAPLELTLEAGDAGTIQVRDAAFLPGGLCAVALGEMGIRLLTRDGRTATHFSQPAYQLVMADSGTHAIARAPRGGVERLARIDFQGRTAAFWCDARIACWAPDYDGSLWFVANGEDLLAIDALADRFQALWHNPELGGEPAYIARNAYHCSTLVRELWKLDAWGKRTAAVAGEWGRRSFQLPRLNFAGRAAAPVAEGLLPEHRSISPAGFIADFYHRPASNDPSGSDLSIMIDGKGIAESFSSLTHAPLVPICGETWLVAPMIAADGVIVLLIDRRLGEVRGRITLGGATQVSPRLTESHLTLADDRGRVIVIDLMSGHVLRNLRVT